MSSRLDEPAAFLVRHRRLVLAGMALLTLFFAAFLPRLRADFSPSELFARVEGQDEILARFHASFGNTDNTLLVLAAAPSVWDADVLASLDALATSLEGLEDVARVDAVVRMPIPRRIVEGPPAGRSEEETLPALLYRSFASASVPLGTLSPLFGLEAPDPPSEELPAPVAALARGESTVWGRVAIEGRVSGEDARLLQREVASNPLVRGQLVTAEGDLAALAVELAAGVTRNEDVQRAARAIAAVVDAHPAPSDTTFRLGGLPWLRTALIERMKADQSVLLPAAIGVCILILWIAFRWAPAMWLPTVAVAMSALILVGGMALFGEPFNILNNIIPLVIIVIGISDAIHLIHRFLEEVPESGSIHEASRRTIVAMASACFLTSFTTAVGFASLLVSETRALQHFGVTAAAGVMIAYLVTILVLPAALAARTGSVPEAHGTTDQRLEGALETFTRAVLRHRWVALAFGTLLLAGSVFVGLRVRVDNAVLDQFDPSDEVWQTARLIEDRLTGIRPLEVHLRSTREGRFVEADALEAMRAAQSWAARQDGVIGSQSAADTLALVARRSPFGEGALDDPEQLATLVAMLTGQPSGPLARWTADDAREGRILIQLRDVGAQRTLAFGRALDDEGLAPLRALDDVEVHLTGDAWVSSLGLNVVITDLAGSLGTAIVIIFAFLLLLFRSLRAGLVSLPPNLIPLGFVLTFMVLRDIPLNAATVIIFSVSIGLAVDGTIHVIARFREELAGSRSVEGAIVRSMRGTGKAILLTNLSLMIGFGVMLVSSFVPVRLFGTLICVTVVGCTVATLVVLPALLRVAWGETHRPKVIGST